MKKKVTRKNEWLDFSFTITLLFKSLVALGEVIIGVALALIPADKLGVMFTELLARLPQGFVTLFLAQAGQSLSKSTTSFAIIYLLAHGLLKLVTLGLLWRKIFWAYPVSILLFSGFIGYQLAEFFKQGSVAMLVFSAVDLLMILLTLLEYRKMKAQWQKLNLRKVIKIQFLKDALLIKKYREKFLAHSSALLFSANLLSVACVFIGVYYL